MRAWLTSTFPGGRFQKDGNYLCSSPLREDKHPSFSISPEKRAWHDFATGEGGRLSDLCRELGIPEPPREGGTIHTPPPSRPEPSKAEALWNGATPASPEHPYLQRKRLPPDGLRQDGNFLLVPARTLGGRLIGVERIPAEENANPKRLHVGEKAGGFHFIGTPVDGQPIALAEGMATASALFSLSGMVAASVFGAVNLPKAAQLVRAHFPGSEIVVCPDADDAGRKAGEECRALGAVILEHSPDSPPGWDWWDAQAADFDEARGTFKAALKAGRAARVEPEPEILEVDVEPQPEPEPPREERKFRLFRIGEIDLKPPEFLVRGLIEKDSLVCCFGAPESGKSFIGLSLAACVATGLPFFGNGIEEGPAVYIAGEGKNGILRRAAAWQSFNGVSLAEAPFYLSSTAADFLDDAGLAEVVEAVDAVAEAEEKPPLLVVVDTVSRCFGTGDENATQDMKRFVDSLDFLRLRYPGAVILAIHHSGVAETSRGRGSSVLRASLDAEFKVAKDGDIITMTATKTKDAARPKPLYFELEGVVLGETVEGDEYGSAALRMVEEKPRGEGKDELTKLERYGLDSFRRAAEKSGELDGLGKFAGLGLEEWRGEFYKGSTADKPGTKRQQFTRAREGLVSKGRLTVSDDVYRLAGPLAGIEEGAISEKLRKAREEKESPGND